MAKIKGAIVVDTERCKGCSLCVVACPLHVIALTKEVNIKGYNYAHQILEDTCAPPSAPTAVSRSIKSKSNKKTSKQYGRRSSINER